MRPFDDSRTRYAALILLVALLACAAVAAFRFRAETHARRVEIVMDYGDFVQFAHSYAYNPEAFLVALRRAGLTSLALSEELGSGVGDSGNAYAISGSQVLQSARLAPLSDPVLAALIRTGKVQPDVVYLAVYNDAAYRRYQSELPLHFGAHAVRLLRRTKPWLYEIRTQFDFFNNTALGIPDDQLALARKLHFLIVPRFQNDERFGSAQIAQLLGSLGDERKVSTVIFFGLRNQVLGYPDHIDDAAAAFKTHAFSFGTIETYDESQVQKGNDTLAKAIPGRTVRVEAIAKTELDKLTFDDVVARYGLGVNERNVRVVYVRPFAHQNPGMSIEATNVALIERIARDITSHGLRLGRATPIPEYRGDNPVLVGIATLAVPSILVLLLGAFGCYRRDYAIAIYLVCIALYMGGALAHHAMLARSILALLGALGFSAAAFLMIAQAFEERPQSTLGGQIVHSASWMLVAIGVALAGALVVVGIMSAPLAMEEIERFRGVKAILALPPLIALVIYIFDRRFDAAVERPQTALLAPVRIYHLLLGVAVLGAGALLVMRSGNQSDIAPSAFELWTRAHLSSALGVRPRFKEFLVGYPLLMLVPALAPAHRRAIGWLLALGVGIGIGDVIDTFSHLHTPLIVSLIRVVLGAILGIAIGALVIAVYRRFVLARSS